MHDSPAVSHHDTAPDDVATGAGLVARVVFVGGVWACSLQTSAAYPGAGGMLHVAVSWVKHPRSPAPDPTAGAIYNCRTTMVISCPEIASGGPSESASIGPQGATTLPSAGSAPGRTIPGAESPA